MCSTHNGGDNMSFWKDIKGYERYEVSKDGRVRNKETGYVMKKRLTFDGYVKVTLTVNGKSKDFRVHRLVAEAFIPNPENKPTVNHEDGNKENNHVSNLKWATRSEQNEHAYKNGLKKPVYTNRKLTDEQVREIRRRYKRGCKENGSGALSKEYGITDANVLKVAKGVSYKNVK